MAVSPNPISQEFMTNLINSSPRSIEEFYEIFEKTIRDISDAYGITSAECSFIMPKGSPNTSTNKKSVILQSSLSETKQLQYQYPFEAQGLITFVIDVADTECSAEDTYLLSTYFNQMFHILKTLIFSIAFQQLSMTDITTGAPNLNKFSQFVGKLIEDGQIHKYTAIYYNIRNFKNIHRSLSYMEGDHVMKKYCEIVINAISKQEMVARLGGDNFVALILDENIDYFLGLIQNMIVKYPKNEKELVFVFGATIGASNLSTVKNVGEIMLRISMAYQTARENHTSIRYYDRSASLAIQNRQMILAQFTHAIHNRDFFAMYQPKVSTKTYTLSGAEALVRWKRDGKYISPAEFIPILEQDGCITELDFYMLEEVCRFLSSLKNKGLDYIKISVNFSKRHLSNNKLVEEIVETIDRYKIPHQYIVIELTESEDFYNNAIMGNVVNALNTQGIQTSIDDFGTGYSSLSLLNTLKADELKIDRSFILQTDKQDNAKNIIMLKGIVTLAKDLGFTTVMEGVETPTQLEIMKNIDCDIIQGYIFDKPLFEDEFIERIKNKNFNPPRN